MDWLREEEFGRPLKITIAVIDKFDNLSICRDSNSMSIVEEKNLFTNFSTS